MSILCRQTVLIWIEVKSEHTDNYRSYGTGNILGSRIQYLAVFWPSALARDNACVGIGARGGSKRNLWTLDFPSFRKLGKSLWIDRVLGSTGKYIGRALRYVTIHFLGSVSYTHLTLPTILLV